MPTDKPQWRRTGRHTVISPVACTDRDAAPAAPLRLLRYALPLLNLLGLLEGFVDRTDHVERLLRKMVALSIDDHLEAADRFLERNVLARSTCEHFRHVERLRQ